MFTCIKQKPLKQFKWKHIMVGNRKNVVVFCHVECQKWMLEKKKSQVFPGAL